ncbi:unnamed protein product [Cochlearia groenlandica]
MASNTNDEDEQIEVHICDMCGDQGFKDLLAICHNCNIGAEHIYCMLVKMDEIPNEWLCYDCTEEENKAREGEEEHERPFIDFFKMEEISSQRQLELLNTQNNNENAGLDLNKDPNIDLNVDPNIDPNIDLNVDNGIDLNVDPNIDINQTPNLDMSLGYSS